MCLFFLSQNYSEEIGSEKKQGIENNYFKFATKFLPSKNSNSTKRKMSKLEDITNLPDTPSRKRLRSLEEEIDAFQTPKKKKIAGVTPNSGIKKLLFIESKPKMI